MDKRGIGVVVVSVFIILITVAAITITWLWIVPWTQDIDSSNNVNANLRIVLEGYTAFDVEHEMAFIQIKRGADEANLVELDIIFEINGNDVTFRTYGVPDNNQMETYYFNFSAAGIAEVPQFVEVAPVFSNREVGVAMGEVAIPVTKVYVDDWVAAGVKAAKNSLKRDRDVIVEIPSEPVDICKADFEVGETYLLDRDFQVTDGNNCFEVSVDDVVLDLNGHLIRGSYSGYGVWITGNNVVVKNGRIERFERGVFIDGAVTDNRNVIDNNDLFDNNNSVYIWLSNENVVSGNEMDGNYSNIYLRDADDNSIVNNWACGSLNDLLCAEGSAGNTGYGEGNVFNTVVSCPGVWSIENDAYTKC